MNGVDDLDDLERELGPSLRRTLRRVAAGITSDAPTPSASANDRDPASRSAQDGVVMVELHSAIRAPTARQRRRRLTVSAVISAAAVAIVVTAAVLLSPLDHDEAADRRAGATAESFMTAWVRGDSDALATLLAPDGFFDAWAADTLPALDDWFRVLGWQYQDEGCQVMSPERVWCDYLVENALTRAFGREPIAGSFVVIIDGDTVTSVRDDLNIGAYRDIWTAFSDWVGVHHPDDVDRMFTSAAGYARVNPRSIELWERHTREFVESGDAYIARARAICTAAHEKYDGLVEASAGGEPANFETAGRVLREALAELQALPPPTAVEASFAGGFTAIEQLVDAIIRLIPAGQTGATTTDALPSPTDQDLANLQVALVHSEIGLERCAIDPLRGR